MIGGSKLSTFKIEEPISKISENKYTKITTEPTLIIQLYLCNMIIIFKIINVMSY